MDIQDVREYNKIVIEVSKEMSRPWKWSTVILSVLLAGMLALYFFNPASIDIEQLANESTNVQNTAR